MTLPTDQEQYPSHGQHLAWYAEWQTMTAPRMLSLEQYGHFLAAKVVDWQIARASQPVPATAGSATSEAAEMRYTLAKLEKHIARIERLLSEEA
jgi:hypothetical protein